MVLDYFSYISFVRIRLRKQGLEPYIRRLEKLDEYIYRQRSKTSTVSFVKGFTKEKEACPWMNIPLSMLSRAINGVNPGLLFNQLMSLENITVEKDWSTDI